MSQTKKEQTFENALSRLEEIASKLSSGETDMDEALSLFEEGVSLSSFCEKKLREAEQKITLITLKENKDNQDGI